MSCNVSECPLCGASAPLVNCDEVDIGVGFITGNHSWECPHHGEFAGWTMREFPGYTDADIKAARAKVDVEIEAIRRRAR